MITKFSVLRFAIVRSPIFRQWDQNNSSVAVHHQVVENDIPNQSNRLKELSVTETSKDPLQTFEKKEYSVGYYEAPIVNLLRQQTGTIQLPEAIFGEAIRPDIIHRCLLSRLSIRKNQDGVKPTKLISDVSGSNKKMKKQKGTGGARKGQRRVGIHRGGEKAHGRYLRDVSFKLQDKVYKFGMRSALSAKYALGEFIVLDKVTTKSHQTAQLYDLLRKFKWGDKIIFIDTNVEKKFRLASRNIPTIDVSTLRRINILDILRKKLVIMTPRAVESLESIYHPSDSYRRSLRIEAAPSTEEQTTTKE